MILFKSSLTRTWWDSSPWWPSEMSLVVVRTRSWAALFRASQRAKDARRRLRPHRTRFSAGSSLATLPRRRGAYGRRTPLPSWPLHRAVRQCGPAQVLPVAPRACLSRLRAELTGTLRALISALLRSLLWKRLSQGLLGGGCSLKVSFHALSIDATCTVVVSGLSEDFTPLSSGFRCW